MVTCFIHDCVCAMYIKRKVCKVNDKKMSQMLMFIRALFLSCSL